MYFGKKNVWNKIDQNVNKGGLGMGDLGGLTFFFSWLVYSFSLFSSMFKLSVMYIFILN